MKSRLLFLFLLCSLFTFSQNEALFEQGNKHYKDGNYESAISLWEKVLDSGVHSAELYYNLGNAYFKIESLAESIYFYEKALQLAPGDKDIRNNLAIAQNSAIDIIEPLPKNLFKTWLDKITQLFSYDVWAKVAVVCVLLFSFCFILYYLAKIASRKRTFFSASLILLFLAFSCMYFAFNNYDTINNQKIAIVFEKSSQVRSEPVLRSEVSFTLHEGTKVEILDEDEDWFRIQLADGKEGWMPKGHLKKL